MTVNLNSASRSASYPGDGLPAQLVTGRVSLHEGPDLPAGDWHWRHAGEEEEPNSLIHLHPCSEELTWGGGKEARPPGSESSDDVTDDYEFPFRYIPMYI